MQLPRDLNVRRLQGVAVPQLTALVRLKATFLKEIDVCVA